ncbi:response regulator [Burkholderia sp. SRS-W-2-2016]|uniref:response regulator n=1 Tax=Burkholderia sp. SRS-W-2-2016 TaxID=1926878 RepID=UPI00094B2698|nr:response regulator [Burkholderia sp. SRS-W-2-2016]OLL30077.1 response regulator [Burkholderia sp. SRS-W-2-2016]
MPPSAFYPILRPWTTRRVALHGERLRVTVVDDNHDGADALAAYLSLHDIQCRAVYSGKDAIAIGSTWPSHLFLMDVSMPGCNGLQVARSLRLAPETATVLVIAHTALDELSVRQHSTDGEFDGYFQKGWDPKQLIWLLAKLIG